LLEQGADQDRGVKHLIDCTNFWPQREARHLVILAYLYDTTELVEAWSQTRPFIQTLRLAVENYRA
jgi:hypothetical protein